MSLNLNRPAPLRLVAALLACLLLLAACGSDDADDGAAGDAGSDESTTTTGGDADASLLGLDPQPLAERTTIKANVGARVENYAVLFLADALGEFDKENLDIELSVIPSADALPLLAQGEIDVMAFAMAASMLNAIDSGMELRWIAPIQFGPGENLEGLWVRPDLVDGAPESLVGETIATGTGPGSNTLLFIGDYLTEGGVDPSSVKIERIQSADLTTALENGAVAAAWLTSPQWNIIQESGAGELVYQVQDSGMVNGAIFAGPSMLDGDPAVTQAFVRAIGRTIRDHLQGNYREDPEVNTALAEALEREPAELSALPPYEFDPALPFEPDDLQRLQEYMLLFEGVLQYSEPLPFERVADASFVLRTRESG